MSGDFDAATVVRCMDAALNDPAGELAIASAALLDLFPEPQVKASLEHLIGKLDSRVQLLLLEPFEAAGLVGSMAKLFVKSIERGREGGKRRALMQIMRSLTIVRSTIALEDKEKGYVRSMAVLFADGSITPGQFRSFLAEFCWHESKCVIMAPAAAAGHNIEPQARELLSRLMTLHLRPYQQFLAATANKIARNGSNGRESGEAIRSFLSGGNSWGDAAGGTSDTYGLDQTEASLLVGFTGERQQAVWYAGDESLITIAGPGTGKSQVQVIPNLICYPGSAFVLDVKGELWERTAGHRARHYGPVFRFAPTDPTGETHCFNPFDFISDEPHQAAVDCEVVAAQIIPARSEAKDPFWDNRGRDFLWTFVLATALAEPPERRNLATVMEMLSVPVRFDSEEAYQRSPTPALVQRLKILAERFNIPALAQSAVAIESGQNDRMDGVFDAARRYLTIFARSARLRQAMGRSDWSPLDLRRHPGTTVYLCLSGDDIETYMPIVRLILQQHANLLLASPRGRGMPPITFFLDEFPQLGRMESIQRLLDVGRGAGLRLWLFAQYMGQLREAYDRRADGLIQACRIRSFMQPDNEAVKFLGPQLGTVEHLFSGQRRALAEDYQLMGQQFADKIIVTARGHAPVLLTKRYAWRDLQQEMSEPLPPVRSQSYGEGGPYAA
jgi:type IV secretion system protein VirD4